MAKLWDRVRETSTTTGTGTYTLAGAVTGYRTFASVATTADTTYYCAEDGTNWEIGLGTLTTGAPWTLARTAIIASSNAGAAVSWAAGTRNIFCTSLAGQSYFPQGTAMLFAQTAAPTGWTKSVTHDNKALRIVSGTAGSGGTSAFTTVLASRTPAGSVSTSGSYSGSTGYTSVGGTDTITAAGSVSISGAVSSYTLLEADIPSHLHTVANTGSASTIATGGSLNNAASPRNTSSTGGSGGHSHGNTFSGSFSGTGHSHSIPSANHYHTDSGSISASSSFSGTAMDFAVQYVDAIIATKD